jgi:hypothetical protein
VRRPILAAIAGVAALGAASTAIILRVTSESRAGLPVTPDPTPIVPGATLPGDVLPSANGAASTRPLSGAAPALPAAMLLRVPSSARVSEEERSWEQIRPLAKPIAPLVHALAEPVAPCFDEYTQARFGPKPHTSLSDVSGSGSGLASLMLELEAVDGGLRIVDAPVAQLGAAGDGLVACAQQVLRGRTILLPQLQYPPGEHLTMIYALRPTATAAPPGATSPTGAGALPVPESTVRRQRGKTGSP